MEYLTDEGRSEVGNHILIINGSSKTSKFLSAFNKALDECFPERDHSKDKEIASSPDYPWNVELCWKIEIIGSHDTDPGTFVPSLLAMSNHWREVRFKNAH